MSAGARKNKETNWWSCDEKVKIGLLGERGGEREAKKEEAIWRSADIASLQSLLAVNSIESNRYQ